MAKKRTKITKLTKYGARYHSNNYLYTKGGEFSLDGLNYIGEYHYQDVLVRTGPVEETSSKTLQRFYNNPNVYIYDKLNNFQVQVLKYVDPIFYLYNPKREAYSAGYDSRYFVEKVQNEGFAIEINEAQYNNIGKPNKGIDSGLYTSAIISWKLVGSIQDITEYNYRSLHAALNTVPSITYAVRSYIERAEITLLNPTYPQTTYANQPYSMSLQEALYMTEMKNKTRI